MWIYGALSKLLPDSKFKTSVRDFCFGNILYKVTRGTAEYPLKDGLWGKFHKLVFLPNGEYTCELIGYEKHYSIKEGDVVIDAGAYLGHFTVYAAMKVGKTGTVVAFEPDPYIYRLLLRNIELNHLTNVLPINKGVWSHDTELAFDSRGNASQIVIEGPHSKTLVKKITVIGLDSEMQRLGLPRIDLVKMDIEGAELEAVQGSRRLMEHSNCHFAIASYHIVNGVQTSVALENFFHDTGYKAVTEYPAHQTTYAAKTLERTTL